LHIVPQIVVAAPEEAEIVGDAHSRPAVVVAGMEKPLLGIAVEIGLVGRRIGGMVTVPAID
jgi:hypothetical protein